MPEKNTEELVGVDLELSLYELTDLFDSYYRYHNDDYILRFDKEFVTDLSGNRVPLNATTLSRFESFRRMEAMRLGLRPYIAREGIAPHIPNQSLGYFSQFLTYARLPYKSVLSDSDLVKVRIDQRLYNEENLSTRQKEEWKLQAKNNPNLSQNAEVSNDVSKTFSEVLKMSKKFREFMNTVPLSITQYGFAAALHKSKDWRPEYISPLDLVTEPQVAFDPSNWSCFFVIRKLSASEAVRHIKKKTSFWNPDALRWALESAHDNRGLLSYRHYKQSFKDTTPLCGENYQVRSFYDEKSSRIHNIGGYYGNMLVADGYYINTEGKVNHVIFFPSEDFKGVDPGEKKARRNYFNQYARNSGRNEEYESFRGADVLFFNPNAFDSIQDAVTVIPFSREELSLERQRAYGHELYAPIELAMRIDSSISNTVILMGHAFYKDVAEGTTAEHLEDLEINLQASATNLGTREFIQAPFAQDLTGMSSVRNMLLQHVASKCFLGGLDGDEMKSTGRGANLANMRLIRDSRVHKHLVEDFAEGLRDLFLKVFKKILMLNNENLIDENSLLQKRFFDTLTKLHGHREDLFEYDADEVLEDTGLPYWMDIETIRNGASHFGAAELVVYSEIKNVFGDGLSQQALQNLNRNGITSILGQQDALDILGDPQDQLVTSQDQLYRASMETATMVGSSNMSATLFRPIGILPDKDDHMLHLTQSHMPQMQQIIQKLETGDVTPDKFDTLTEHQLETRNNLILQLAIIANHASQHGDMLKRFGGNRPEIKRINEELNNQLQAAEGLLNSMQASARALLAKRQETEMRLRNISPENELEKMQVQLKLEQVALQKEQLQGQLELGRIVADDNRQKHVDQQVSKARDREQKREAELIKAQLKAQEIETKRIQGNNAQRSFGDLVQ